MVSGLSGCRANRRSHLGVHVTEVGTSWVPSSSAVDRVEGRRAARPSVSSALQVVEPGCRRRAVAARASTVRPASSTLEDLVRCRSPARCRRHDRLTVSCAPVGRRCALGAAGCAVFASRSPVRAVLEPLEGVVDLLLGGRAADPLGALDGLAGLEVLVDLEEVLDLDPVVVGHVADVAQVLEPRVGRRHAEHLVVAAGLVGHPEHPDRAAPDQAAGERRLLEDHHRVERVAVEAQGVLDVAVVGRVLRRGEQRPVQPDPTGDRGRPRTCCAAPWGSPRARRTPCDPSSRTMAP